MRIWKNNENNLFNPKLKKILLVCAIPGFLFLPTHLILYHAITYEDIFDFIGSSFVIYLVKYNGAYKIARIFAERYVKSKDNKWKMDEHTCKYCAKKLDTNSKRLVHLFLHWLGA